MSAKKARDPIVNASGSTISEKTALCTRTCITCLGTFHPKSPRQRFCSAHCRLLAWAVEALATALKEGKAEGLREKIEELGSGKLEGEVVHAQDEGRLS